MLLKTLKSILLCCCILSVVCIVWITFTKYELEEGFLWRSLQQGGKPRGLVYILLWSGERYTPFTGPGTGQNSFTSRKCPVTNCFVTTDRNFFGGDTRNFDFIAFMSLELFPNNIPEMRSPHQRYIFISIESSSSCPVFNSVFDGFFNWTATHRHDSEISLTYILIKDKKGNKIGPKKEMNWSAVLEDKEEYTDFEFDNKTKAAAIFVSNCNTKSGRERIVKNLAKELEPYNLTVDIYGACGPYKCPRDKKDECERMLATDYYFYLSFENSFDEDYVTEKLLTALQNNVVPIVYGGANYNRFLPPGSYLNAREPTIQALAHKMVHLMKNPKEYKQYFKWKKYYTYHDPLRVENICNICAGVNDPSLLKKSRVYDRFRSWWNDGLSVTPLTF